MDEGGMRHISWFLLRALGLCVWLQMSLYCLKIEWLGIKTVNISLSCDGDQGDG